MIAQIIGKGLPSILMVKNSGNPIFLAIHMPRYAPIKPTIIDTRHPPRSYPANDCPIAPQIAAIASRTKNPISVMVINLIERKKSGIYYAIPIVKHY